MKRQLQLTLDFGQKKFGSTRCSQCGMIYTISDEYDCKAHKSYHRAKLFPTVRLPRGQHQRIIEEHFGGSRIIELLLTNKNGLNCFAQISAVMSLDLGYDKPSDGVFNSNKDYVTINAEKIRDLDWRVYAYVIDVTHLVVGCCIVEELTPEKIASKGYKIVRLNGGRKSLLSWKIRSESTESVSDNSEPTDHILPSPEINEPFCGVRRLWVAKSYRRKRIATTLLDSVLRTLVYSHPLSRTQIAFAEPTGDGADFAVHFVGREDFLLY